MSSNETKTIDINTMLQRLSFLAQMPPLTQMKNDEYDEYSDGSSSEQDEEDTTHDKTSMITEEVEQGSEQSNIDDKEKFAYNGIVDFTDCKEEFLENYQQFKLEPISIKTDFTCSIDNEKSPRSQLFDLALELENERRDNNTLKDELEELKKTKIKDDELIKNMSDEIKTLKNELNISERLITELKFTSQINHNRFDQLDSLRSENLMLTEKLKSLEVLSTQQTHQIEKLQKYESYFKNYTFVQVNKYLYQIVNKIGQGGFSEVYHCISFRENKSYAMKKVKLSEIDEESVNLVMNEITLLKKLQDTGKVIRLYDYEYVKKDNHLNLVMEIGSTDLSVFFKREIQKYKCVKEPTRGYFWQKMLEAVHAIHNEGVIHSDIKPGNFLVVGCEVKLIDFNISNTISDKTSITLTNDCGTLHYMAPETLLRDNDSKTRITKKTDVWSLGIILYFITFGKLPFQHIKNQYKMIHAICDPLQKDLSFGPLDNPELEDVIKNCLAHEPSARYSIDKLLEHPYLKSI
ncbi:dual specificity kinase TTK isoform X3 [Brachionus plicatilis]|uniref:Dual specificity kinase TTK isoform X3 n=1 Tax=Brachionus plicatilis TaxID=10195 RepID=A0A3M7SB78_BRAPC|nr:dual specificity kinase TTK isoform X3 [Brachionus plicatilis]